MGYNDLGLVGVNHINRKGQEIRMNAYLVRGKLNISSTWPHHDVCIGGIDKLDMLNGDINLGRKGRHRVALERKSKARP